LVYNKSWHSRWYADRDYAKTLHADLGLRQRLKQRLSHAGVSEVDVERAADRLRVTIYTSRPGIIIGRKGAEVDKLRDELTRRMGQDVHINIQEIQRPELDSQLVAESIGNQLLRRVAFRRAMKKAMESAFRFGAKGVKIMVSGRLGGAEIARSEWYQEGRLPLHTLKADIDYGFAEAQTSYGVIGVKVWIYKGDLSREKGHRAVA
jgi:small subunit ribosomal protein S3